MTQRVRALLDEAVSRLEPSTPDPVAAVVARGRAARRRSLGAAILAGAVLIRGGLVVGLRPGGREAPPPPGRAAAAAAGARAGRGHSGGGEPAWLNMSVDDPMNSPAKAPGFRYFNTLLLPWSRVSVTFRMPGPEQQRAIDSMRTAPGRGTTRLVVPGTVAEVSLTVPDPS